MGVDQAISKILDRFMVEEKLLIGNLILKSITETRGNSDRRPVSLIINPPENKPQSPLKFNPLWVEEDEYKDQIISA